MAGTSDQSSNKLLLADANILIDLFLADALGLISELSRYGIAKIFIPRIIYDEVSTQISENSIMEFGITILPVTVELSQRVLDYPDQRLSIPDRSLLLMAESESFGVWTNDRRLRENCRKCGIEVWWEFQLLKELVVVGGLDRDALFAVAKRIEELNPFMRGLEARLQIEMTR